jgi:hypothetical protein
MGFFQVSKYTHQVHKMFMPSASFSTKPSFSFDPVKCVSVVMGTKGTRGLFNYDAEPEVALLWDIIKSHWRNNQQMFKIGERVDDVLPVRVQGLLDFAVEPIIYFNLKPGLPYIINVTMKWATKEKSKTIVLCYDTYKENEAKKAAAAAAGKASAPPPPAPEPYTFGTAEEFVEALMFPPLAPLPPPPAPAPPPPAPVPPPPAPAPPPPAPAPPPPPPAPVAVVALLPPRKAPYTRQLTMERVREIRKFKTDNPGWSASAIAKHFDIQYNVAYKMLAGNSYKEAT